MPTKIDNYQHDSLHLPIIVSISSMVTFPVGTPMVHPMHWLHLRRFVSR